jgi:hypothetical protein
MPLPLGVELTRKLAVLFSFNRGVRTFYAAHRFDELSRVSTTSQHSYAAFLAGKNTYFRSKHRTRKNSSVS